MNTITYKPASDPAAMTRTQYIPPPIADLIQPPDCFGCCHWHGKAHWSIRWVCQPYPDGWQHKYSPCPHYQREAHD